jgi:hypothetical protein
VVPQDRYTARHGSSAAYSHPPVAPARLDRTLVVAAALDLYNPGTCAQWAAAEIPSCRCVTYDSPWGHVLASAADASTAPLLRAEIRQFLRETYEMTSGTKA